MAQFAKFEIVRGQPELLGRSLDVVNWDLYLQERLFYKYQLFHSIEMNGRMGFLFRVESSSNPVHKGAYLAFEFFPQSQKFKMIDQNSDLSKKLYSTFGK
ncbi:MAG: hypothetical protein FWD49_02480 [Firmicutes bacterium]|nr:hypothetical protein [Bacillota bacterium]